MGMASRPRNISEKCTSGIVSLGLIFYVPGKSEPTDGFVSEWPDFSRGAAKQKSININLGRKALTDFTACITERL